MALVAPDLIKVWVMGKHAFAQNIVDYIHFFNLHNNGECVCVCDCVWVWVCACACACVCVFVGANVKSDAYPPQNLSLFTANCEHY